LEQQQIMRCKTRSFGSETSFFNPAKTMKSTETQPLMKELGL